jgi:hypothetical protein
VKKWPFVSTDSRVAPAPTPQPEEDESAVPAIPCDYWLHVRGCDCAYCAWERKEDQRV